MATDFELEDLRPGDTVRSKLDGEAYIVTDNYGGYVIAVRTAHIMHANEWERVPALKREEPPARPRCAEGKHAFFYNACVVCGVTTAELHSEMLAQPVSKVLTCDSLDEKPYDVPSAEAPCVAILASTVES